MFANFVIGADHTVYSTTTTRRFRLGTLLITEDGRHYRYTENGGTAIGTITGGAVFQSSVPSADHDNQAVAAAAAVGDRSVTVTLGGTPALDLFANGYLAVNDAAGEGVIYHVESSSAATSCVFTLNPPGVRIALTTSSEVNAVLNPYKDVVIQASPPTAPVVGVTPTAWAADVFGWGQTRGPAQVLTDGTVVIGESVMPSNGTDGAVEDWGLAEAAPPTEIGQAIGKVMVVSATTEYSTIWLQID